MCLSLARVHLLFKVKTLKCKVTATTMNTPQSTLTNNVFALRWDEYSHVNCNGLPPSIQGAVSHYYP